MKTSISGRTLLAGIFAAGYLYASAANAASITHQWPSAEGNADNEFDVDDFGGSFVNGGNDDAYNFTVDGDDQTSTLTLILFNGQAVDDGADDQDDGAGNSSTGEDFADGSGLTLLEPPSVLVPPLTEIGAASDNPLTPVSFRGTQTGLDVRQLSYIQSGSNFAILEYVVANNTGAAAPVKIGLAGDFDVRDDSSNNDNNEKDLGIPAVWSYDSQVGANNNFYAAGIALAGGNFDNYRLGACCDVTFETTSLAVLDAHRLAYFNDLPNEECDDGNNVNNDGCSADCKTETGSSTCGNGTIEVGEACDDGNTDSGDGCSDLCRDEDCGNGTIDEGEECDDGNTADNDGCSSFCLINFIDANQYCGDGTPNNGGTGDQFLTESDVEVTLSADLGVIPPGESRSAAFCVVGGTSPTDGPAAGDALAANAQDCVALYQTQIAICGNGIQNAGEECDDGNTVDDDGCASNCQLPGCGNDILEGDEACDDGNNVDGDGCSADCSLESSCGNGVVDTGEECDDGNSQSGDGCDSLCQTEAAAEFRGGGCSLQVAR